MVQGIAEDGSGGVAGANAERFADALTSRIIDGGRYSLLVEHIGMRFIIGKNGREQGKTVLLPSGGDYASFGLWRGC